MPWFPLDLWLVFYLAIGVVVGFLAGLLGVGGGAITIPALTWAFQQRGFGDDQVLHLALGTCMATIVLVSLGSARAHAAHGAVDWSIVRRMTPGIVVGGLTGAWITRYIPTFTLAVLFAVFICYVAFNMVTGWKPKPTASPPGSVGMTAVGVLISVLCALVGVGGAALTIPFLMYVSLSFHHAIGTAAALALPIAIASSIGFVLSGLGKAGLPAGSIGYVYIPAFIGIAIGSVVLTRYGARIAHRTSAKTLKRVFAVILCTLAAKLLWGLA